MLKPVVVAICVIGVCTKRATNERFVPMLNSTLTSLPPAVSLTHRGLTLRIDAQGLGESNLIRKLSSSNGTAVVNDAAIFESCVRASSLPSSPEEFLHWLAAHDHICADPPPEQFLASVARAFRCVLDSGRVDILEVVRKICPTFQTVDARVNRRAYVAVSLGASNALAIANTISVASAAPPNFSRKRTKREKDDDAKASNSERIWTIEKSGAPAELVLRACIAAWKAALAGEHRMESVLPQSGLWRKIQELIRCILMGVCEDLLAAPLVFVRAADFLSILRVEEFRWLARRSLLVMASAEQQVKEFFVGCQFIKTLQMLYKEGFVDLSSLCMLPDALPGSPSYRPEEENPVYLLPCCPGRDDVALVETNPHILRSVLVRRVPWLHEFWRLGSLRECVRYVTGSLLTAALLPRTAELVAPGDVDIFLEDSDDLEVCLEDLIASVAATSRTTTVTVERLSDSKSRLTLEHPGTTTCGVDLYAHPLSRILAYHLSVVRLAFDGEHLYCSPSAAAALSTSVSSEFSLKVKQHRSAVILLRKWQSGLNLIVSAMELQVFLEYLQSDPQILDQLSQPSRLAILKCMNGYFPEFLRLNRRSSASNERHIAQYRSWRL